jgi:hypothetical protein
MDKILFRYRKNNNFVYIRVYIYIYIYIIKNKKIKNNNLDSPMYCQLNFLPKDKKKILFCFIQD